MNHSVLPVRCSLAASLLLGAAGCYTQQQYDQALQRSADLQAQLDQVRALLKTREEELHAEQTRAAELASARARDSREADSLKNEINQLRRNLETARRELEAAAGSLAKEHAELEKALAGRKEARTRMEQELADRDRELDILRSRCRRLERDLDQLRRTVPPTTTQASP